MSHDLKLYFLSICLPAVVLTALGLTFLHRQSQAAAAREDKMRGIQVENLAAALQDTVNESGRTGEVVRVALTRWTGDSTARAPMAAFIWSPKNRLEWSSGVGEVHQDDFPESMRLRLNELSRWNEWTAIGKKRARRGLMQVDGFSILWGRVENAVYGLVYEDHPIISTKRSLDAWFLGGILVVLLAGVLVAGAWLMVRAAAKARRDDQRKTSFVSNVSHELKTPLAGIGLWVDLLKDGRLSTEEKRADAYGKIAGENARMLRLVENLLDFSRLEQGRRNYHIEAVDMIAVTGEVLDFVRDDFSRHGIMLKGEGSCRACADSDAVKQILVNLLGNAAKYAAEGGPIEISVLRNEGMIRVAVADRGPGMPPEAMRRAFERFYRADDALDSRTSGLGLGLSISRALARDLGGELSVAAREGGGCVFTLELMEADT